MVKTYGELYLDARSRLLASEEPQMAGMMARQLISALSGKIGRLKGVSTKTAYSNVITHTEEKHD